MSEGVTLLEVAKAYRIQGLPIVPLKGKQPLADWVKWQKQTQTEEELQSLPWDKADGFAVVCGVQNKDGLYIGVLDFDVKNLASETVEKGRQVVRHLPITQMEETPSGGQHWIYLSRQKPKTISAYHNVCGLELLGEGKLCVMAPSAGYKRLNDNSPTKVENLEHLFFEALEKVGIEVKEKRGSWFDREDIKGINYMGKDPPCITILRRGTIEGLRNEYGIRLASYLANFRGIPPKKVMKSLNFWNKLNKPPLESRELEAILKSAVQGGYVYGCGDDILSQNCDRENCPLALKKQRQLTDDERERALMILERDDILEIVKRVGRKKLIGEDNVLLVNFLEICSGQTNYPISGIIEGFSGSGKNRSIEAVKPLIPEEWLFEFTTSTPEAVKYIPEDFMGTLIIYEAAGIQSTTGSLGLRAVGEGRNIETIYPVRDEATGIMKLHRAKTNAKNFITTQSDVDITEDLERRVFKVSMNHSTLLTKRVLAKKLRDAQLPESLKEILGLEQDNGVNLEDLRNAMRLNEWDREVIVFSPFHILELLNLVSSKEQEVALRTHVERILNFIKVLALLRQRKRTRFEIGDKKFVIASPKDVSDAFKILDQTIVTTVTRLTKRMQEVLEVVGQAASGYITKHEIVEKLKVSEVTARRLLKALHRHGYLTEEREKGNQPYRYALIKKPNLLVNLINTSNYYVFYRKQKENLLKQTRSVVQVKGMPFHLEDAEEPIPTQELTNEFTPKKTILPARPAEQVDLTTLQGSVGGNNRELLVSSGMTSKTQPFTALHRIKPQIYPTEKCACCGEQPVEFQQDFPDGGWRLLCANCAWKIMKGGGS